MDDGMHIRRATPADAGSLLELKQTLDRESEFMMLEPDERSEVVAEVARDLAEIEARANSVVLVADAGEQLLGYVEADGGEFRRNAHSVYVVIGVRVSAAGAGIGTALLRALDAWAADHGVHRLELTVMAHNERAVGLYQRCGYRLEGIRTDSLKVGGRFVDELAMARLL